MMDIWSEINYLDFAKRLTVQPPRYNLGVSGITGIFTPEELAPLQAELRITSPPAEGNEFGYEPLKRELARRHGVDPRWILPTLGTSQANFLLVAALSGKKLKVLVETPTYEPLWKVPQALGHTIRWLPRLADRDWEMDLNFLEDELKHGVDLVILSDPHNPSGEKLSANTVKVLGELAEKYRTRMILDVVYRFFDYHNGWEPPLRDNPRIALTLSLTKAYGLGQLRAGWAVGDPEWLTAADRVRTLSDVLSPFCQEHLVMKILEKGDLLRIAARRVEKRLEINRRTLRSLLEATPGIRYRLPEQGAITFLKLIPWADTRDFTTELLFRHGVLIPDGAFFNKPGYVRLGFGAVPEIFQPAAERFFDLLRHAYSA